MGWAIWYHFYIKELWKSIHFINISVISWIYLKSFRKSMFISSISIYNALYNGPRTTLYTIANKTDLSPNSHWVYKMHTIEQRLLQDKGTVLKAYSELGRKREEMELGRQRMREGFLEKTTSKQVWIKRNSSWKKNKKRKGQQYVPKPEVKGELCGVVAGKVQGKKTKILQFKTRTCALQ